MTADNAIRRLDEGDAAEPTSTSAARVRSPDLDASVRMPSEAFPNELEKFRKQMHEFAQRAKDVDLDYHVFTLLMTDPFFCNISRHIRKAPSLLVPTAAVTYANDEFTLLWNPFFFATLKERLVDRVRKHEIIGVIKHEYYHIILGHITSRLREQRAAWNIATDLAINSLLIHDGHAILPDMCLLPGKRPKTVADRRMTKEETLANEKLADLIESFKPLLSSEQYYNDIVNMCHENGFALGEGDAKIGGIGSFDEHDKWNEVSQAEREYVEQKIKQIVSEAVRLADQTNSWGSVPSWMQKYLRELCSNRIDWRSVLRQFCGMVGGMTRTTSIKRVNRKYPYIHPGVKKNRTARLGIFIDQSGSMSDEHIAMLFSELSQLARKMEFIVHFFDVEVDPSSIVWRRGSSVPPVRRRTGGTDFESVIKYVNARAELFDGALIMTDGECLRPSPCHVKLGWVTVPEHKLPFEPYDNEFLISMDDFDAKY